MATSKTYTGSCHCGANKFTVPISPPLDTKEAKIMACNCSICARNSYLFTFVAEKDLDWSAGSLDNMTKYTFNKKYFVHYFCATCGTSVCVNAEGKVGLNVRVLEDVDVGQLEVGSFNGKSL